MEHKDFIVGVLGGGQLGRMLLEPAYRWGLQTKILDPDPDCPCRHITHDYHQGDFRDYQTVVDFGKKCNVVTIEIEQVNIKALYTLQKVHNIQVYPHPQTLEIIQDKNRQKEFFNRRQFPTSEYSYYPRRPDITTIQQLVYPLFWKRTTMGYDGYGVKKITNPDDFTDLPDVPCILEKVVPIKRELSVIVCCSASGESRAYPPVEMVFDPDTNQVEYVTTLLHERDNPVLKKAVQVATGVSTLIGHVGLLAVELFQTTGDTILVNELAPRPHNSGHLTQTQPTSQFEQHLRAILDYPLGDPSFTQTSVMLNINGRLYDKIISDRWKGEILGTRGLHLQLYGKSTVRPNRKMGHLTLTDPSPDATVRVLSSARILKNRLLS